MNNEEPSELDINESTGGSAQQVDEGWGTAPSEAASGENPGLFAAGSSRLSVGTPSRPLLGRLPLSRVIPQDVHSVMDYAGAGGVLVGAFVSECPKARSASWIIGGAGLVASALTDYRLSLAKVVPIETHEVIDYAFGVSAIAAPFVFGYRKTAPLVAAAHVLIGVGTILASLFTDYRAFRGIGRAARA